MASIRLVIVFMILLLAGRSAGQTNNVYVDFELVGNNIPWGLTTDLGRHDAGFFPITISTSAASTFVGDSINFSLPGRLITARLDSIRRTIKITINYQYFGDDAGHQQWISYALVFDSLPYLSDSAFIFNLVPGVHPGFFNGTVNESTPQPDYGFTNVSLWTTDSIAFRVTKLDAIVAPVKLASGGLIITESAMGIEVTSDVDAPSSFRLFDIAGRSVYSRLVHAGVSAFSIPLNVLHPGCYFARLGTEVAKFCVME